MLFHAPLHHYSAGPCHTQHFLKLNALQALDNVLLILMLPANNGITKLQNKSVCCAATCRIVYICVKLYYFHIFFFFSLLEDILQPVSEKCSTNVLDVLYHNKALVVTIRFSYVAMYLCCMQCSSLNNIKPKFHLLMRSPQSTSKNRKQIHIFKQQFLTRLESKGTNSKFTTTDHIPKEITFFSSYTSFGNYSNECFITLFFNFMNLCKFSVL